MSWSLRFSLVSVLLLLTSLGIVLKQRTARSCPRHQRAAGVAANFVAAACLLAGLLLAGLAAMPLISSPLPP